jgi:hypothetical protein
VKRTRESARNRHQEVFREEELVRANGKRTGNSKL